MMDRLEPRRLMSRAAAETVDDARFDAGDYTYDGDEKVKLFRSTEELLVGVKKGVRAADLAKRLTMRGGALEGWVWLRGVIDDRSLVFVSPTQLSRRGIAGAQRRASATPGVNWAAPAFVREGSELLRRVTNELLVKLEPGADPAEVLGPRFGRYEPVFIDLYLVRTKQGGVPALRLANRLSGARKIAYAQPNWIIDAGLLKSDDGAGAPASPTPQLADPTRNDDVLTASAPSGGVFHCTPEDDALMDA